MSLKLPGRKSRLSVANDEAFLEFVKLCFAQKRKTLFNNLRSIAAPENIRVALSSLKLKPSARAEELSVEQIARLHDELSSKALNAP